jgi:hypothetical protein
MWFPGAGFRRKASVWAATLFEMVEQPHNFVKKQMVCLTPREKSYNSPLDARPLARPPIPSPPCYLKVRNSQSTKNSILNGVQQVYTQVHGLGLHVIFKKILPSQYFPGAADTVGASPITLTLLIDIPPDGFGNLFFFPRSHSLSRCRKEGAGRNRCHRWKR